MGAGALLAGSLLGTGVGGLGTGGRAPDPRIARVHEVVDGDTIRVRFVSGTIRSVRYIGLDTPETPATGQPAECYGRRASAVNRALVPAGERVRLEFDAEREDRYGRLLAYVFRARDELFVNAELLERGYATVLTIRPNVRHVQRFLRLARDARAAGRGLWRACPTS